MHLQLQINVYNSQYWTLLNDKMISNQFEQWQLKYSWYRNNQKSYLIWSWIWSELILTWYFTIYRSLESSLFPIVFLPSSSSYFYLLWDIFPLRSNSYIILQGSIYVSLFMLISKTMELLVELFPLTSYTDIWNQISS